MLLLGASRNFPHPGNFAYGSSCLPLVRGKCCCCSKVRLLLFVVGEKQGVKDRAAAAAAGGGKQDFRKVCADMCAKSHFLRQRIKDGKICLQRFQVSLLTGQPLPNPAGKQFDDSRGSFFRGLTTLRSLTLSERKIFERGC